MNRFTRPKPVPRVQIMIFFVGFCVFCQKVREQRFSTGWTGLRRIIWYSLIILFDHELKFCAAQLVTKMTLENIVQHKMKKQFLRKKQKEKQLAKARLIKGLVSLG